VGFTFHLTPTPIMTPTRKDFALAATSPSGCGFTNEQIKILGMDPRKQWLKMLIGTQIPDEVWEAFVRAGDSKRKLNYRKQNRRVEDGPTQFMDEGSISRSLNSIHRHPSESGKSLPATSFIPEPARNELFQSEDWKFARAFVLRRDKYTCQHCRAKGVRLHVDHKIPITVDWSRRLDLLNLQTLCEDCNVGKSNYFIG